MFGAARSRGARRAAAGRRRAYRVTAHRDALRRRRQRAPPLVDREPVVVRQLADADRAVDLAVVAGRTRCSSRARARRRRRSSAVANTHVPCGPPAPSTSRSTVSGVAARRVAARRTASARVALRDATRGADARWHAAARRARSRARPRRRSRATSAKRVGDGEPRAERGHRRLLLQRRSRRRARW